jgi:hypothetical protein
VGRLVRRDRAARGQEVAGVALQRVVVEVARGEPVAAEVVGRDPPVADERVQDAAPDLAVAPEPVGEEGGGGEPRPALLNVEPNAVDVEIASPQLRPAGDPPVA